MNSLKTGFLATIGAYLAVSVIGIFAGLTTKSTKKQSTEATTEEQEA